jgi:ADP-ribose pyrophosphatase YjhB (NUDIX family)
MNSKLTYDAQKHILALDCIVFGFDEDQLKLLMIKRRIEPHKNDWSLMSGFVRVDESLDEAARRILLGLTGLSNVYLEQLYTFGDTYRDPIDRVVSVAYYALIKIDNYDREIVKQNGAVWFPAEGHPDLVFDHGDMAQMALNKLRRKCRTQPIGFELLPEKFTIPQLQSLYEAILMKKFDKRNFRKKLLSMNLLDKLDEKDKENSKKGAFLYRFNKERYEALTKMGFSFEL